MGLIFFGLGLLAGSFLIAIDTAIAPFAAYRGVNRPLAERQSSNAVSAAMPRPNAAVPMVFTRPS